MFLTYFKPWLVNQIEPSSWFLKDWGFLLMPFWNASRTPISSCEGVFLSAFRTPPPRPLRSHLRHYHGFERCALFSCELLLVCLFNINSKSVTLVEAFHLKDLSKWKNLVKQKLNKFGFVFVSFFAVLIHSSDMVWMDLHINSMQRNKETETSCSTTRHATDKLKDIACVFSLVFKPCWNFTAASAPKWRLSLNNLQLHFFTIHTCTHMLDICPLHPHPWISLCGSTLHIAIKPSGSSLVPLAHVSLKSCVMLAGKWLISNIHRQQGCIQLYEKLFSPGSYLPLKIKGESPKCQDDGWLLNKVKFSSKLYDARAVMSSMLPLPSNKGKKWLVPAWSSQHWKFTCVRHWGVLWQGSFPNFWFKKLVFKLDLLSVHLQWRINSLS